MMRPRFRALRRAGRRAPALPPEGSGWCRRHRRLEGRHSKPKGMLSPAASVTRFERSAGASARRKGDWTLAPPRRGAVRSARASTATRTATSARRSRWGKQILEGAERSCTISGCSIRTRAQWQAWVATTSRTTCTTRRSLQGTRRARGFTAPRPALLRTTTWAGMVRRTRSAPRVSAQTRASLAPRAAPARRSGRGPCNSSARRPRLTPSGWTNSCRRSRVAARPWTRLAPQDRCSRAALALAAAAVPSRGAAATRSTSSAAKTSWGVRAMGLTAVLARASRCKQPSVGPTATP
mmetsp:Transcript_3585/g.14518  ORF Transcript_3585/g.14518 Transcript_3585/m.14518 type:complete len:295 (+) Transcript_3585:947-1831(+)